MKFIIFSMKCIFDIGSYTAECLDLDFYRWFIR